MKTIGIYIGKFQPPHRGNYNIYKKLKQIAGSETYIATDGVVEFPDNPLSLGEKEQIFVRHGVPSNRIVKVVNIFRPDEIIDRNNTDTTNIIIAVEQRYEAKFLTQKSKDETGKEIWLDVSGKPSKYQPYRGNEDNINPSINNIYIMFFKVEIDGRVVSGENIRHGLTSPHYTDEARRKFFQWAFGWYDVGLYQLITERFKTSKEFNKPPSQPRPADITPLQQPVNVASQKSVAVESYNSLKARIKPVIKKLVREYMTSFPSATPQDGPDAADTIQEPGATERRRDASQARQDAQKKKAAEERTLSAMKADVTWKEKDLKRKKRDELPAQRKKIDGLNKTISSGGKATSSANLTEVEAVVVTPDEFRRRNDNYELWYKTLVNRPDREKRKKLKDRIRRGGIVYIEDIPNLISYDRPTKDYVPLTPAQLGYTEPKKRKIKSPEQIQRQKYMRASNALLRNLKSKENPIGIWQKLKKAYKDAMGLTEGEFGSDED